MKRAIAVALFLAGTGCSTTRDASEFFAPGEAGTLVVDGMLVVGKPFPSIRVTHVLPPGTVYTPEAAAESGVIVRIVPATGTPVQYSESSIHGVYLPIGGMGRLIQPETEYQLLAATRDGRTVSASTRTPAPLQVDSWVLLEDDAQTVRRELATYPAAGDSIYSRPENQLVYAEGLLEARFLRPGVEGFQVGVSSLDLDSDFVIHPEFFSQEDYDSIKRDGSSPPLEAADGKARLPWFAIFFEGRYKIRILALDHNAYDFVRSIARADGGFTFGGSPGDRFERPVFHVDGGIGLFGSASADSIGFYIHPQQGP